MHKKYGISRIVRILYSVKSNNYTHLDVHGDGVMNQQSNETYDLQFTHGKIIITITIITEYLRLNYSILIYNNLNN